MSRPALAHADRVEARWRCCRCCRGGSRSAGVHVVGARCAARARRAGPAELGVHAAPTPPPGAQPQPPSNARAVRVRGRRGRDPRTRKHRLARAGRRARGAAHRLRARRPAGVERRAGPVNGAAFTLTGTAGPIEGAAWPVEPAARRRRAGRERWRAPRRSRTGRVCARPRRASGAGRPPVAGLRDVRLAGDAVGRRPDRAPAAGGARPSRGRCAWRKLDAHRAVRRGAGAGLHAELHAGKLASARSSPRRAASARCWGAARSRSSCSPPPGTRPLGARHGCGCARRRAGAAVSAKVPDLARLGALAGARCRRCATSRSTPGSPLVPKAGWRCAGCRLTSQQGDLPAISPSGWRPAHPARLARRAASAIWTRWRSSPVPADAPPPPQPRRPRRRPGRRKPTGSSPTCQAPVPALRRADADLHASVGEAVWRGVAYHAVDARAAAAGRAAAARPGAACRGPAGRMRGQLLADATAQPPTALGRGRSAGPGCRAGRWPCSARPADDEGHARPRRPAAGQGRRTARARRHARRPSRPGDGGRRDRQPLARGRLLADTLRAANLPLESRRHEPRPLPRAAGGRRRRAGAAPGARARHEPAEAGRGGRAQPGQRDGSTCICARSSGSARRSNIPVRVTGPLRAPKVALDAGAIAPGRVGISIGGAAAGRHVRPGARAGAGRAPGAAPPPPEPNRRRRRPADLLRGLLR